MREMNLSEGSVFKKIIIYSLPLIATNTLQLLFNAADIAVLGQFVGDEAVAAVGATTALINLIVGLFVGFSVGANVLVARCVGEGNKERSHKIVGLSVLVSIISGIVLAFIGFFGARTFLELMNCDPAVIDMAAKYMKIYFIGMPIMMLYNFCASILRAVGDTVRPLLYLVLGGVLNIGLNLFFILVLNKTVEGVAIATVAAQGVSAVLAIIALSKSNGYSKLSLKYIKIYPAELWDMIKIGVPSGLQGCLFSVSNVLVQSSINSFGKTVMTANTIACQFDGFIFSAMNGVALSSLSFVSQNYGARKPDRIYKTVGVSISIVMVLWLVICGVMLFFADKLCGIMTKDPQVIEIAKMRLNILCITYFTCGIMEVLSNTVRGLGHSALAMIISLSGVCLFRILWLNTVFVLVPKLEIIYWAYPASWTLSALTFVAAFAVIMKKVRKKLALSPDTAGK